jgi:hypothetical protein
METSAELSKLPEKIEIFRRKIQIVSGTPGVPAEIRNFSGKIKSSAEDFRIQRKIQIRRWKTKTSAGKLESSAEGRSVPRKIQKFSWKIKSSAADEKVPEENRILPLKIQIFRGRQNIPPENRNFSGTFGTSAEVSVSRLKIENFS